MNDTGNKQFFLIHITTEFVTQLQQIFFSFNIHNLWNNFRKNTYFYTNIQKITVKFCQEVDFFCNKVVEMVEFDFMANNFSLMASLIILISYIFATEFKTCINNIK